MNDKYRRRGYNERYPQLLNEIQQKQTEMYWQLNQQKPKDATISRQLMIPFISKYISDLKVTISEYSTDELAEKVYNDLQEYSILTGPLADPEVEGININAWNNIRIKFRDGQSQKIDGFNSPQHAIDVIKRLIQESNQTIDEAVPTAESSLNSRIRITVLIAPVVDADVAVSGYIRIMGDQIFEEKDYLAEDFAAPQEMHMLQIALRRGISILLVGKVDTGKTTLITYLLSTLPDEYELITIEQGAREMNLIKTDDKGNVKNNVIHLLARESSIEEQNITQEKLVEKALRLNPDVLSVAEMRNVEAYAAQEASLSGHTVISSAHAGGPKQAHKRVAMLCRKKYPTDFATAKENASEAFPLVVTLHSLEDYKRRIVNVSECLVNEGHITYHTLWEYQINENTTNERGVCVNGNHVQINNVSEQMITYMKMYGISRKEIEEISKEDEEVT